MDLMSWLTFGLGAIGTGLGVFNTVVAYRRGAVRWRLQASVEPFVHGKLALKVELINTGNVAIRIEEVCFLRGRAKQPLPMDRLHDRNGNPFLPYKLEPLAKLTIWPVSAEAIDRVLVDQPLSIVAKSQDGRQIKARCTRLRELYAQHQAAAAES